MYVYCIFCKTGLEESVCKNINKIITNFEAVIPTKIIKEKRNGKWEDKKQILLPGYVFLYGENKLEIYLKDKIFNMHKILQYDTGKQELIGSDYDYAMWVYRHNGSIVTSKVLTEGRSIKVIEGPLLDFNGIIVKLDKHKKKAWVEIDFNGEKRVITLTADCVVETNANEISA